MSATRINMARSNMKKGTFEYVVVFFVILVFFASNLFVVQDSKASLAIGGNFSEEMQAEMDNARVMPLAESSQGISVKPCCSSERLNFTLSTGSSFLENKIILAAASFFDAVVYSFFDEKQTDVSLFLPPPGGGLTSSVIKIE